MSDKVQIAGIAVIILTMMFAIGIILDYPDIKEFKKGLVLWLYVLCLIISQTIF